MTTTQPAAPAQADPGVVRRWLADERAAALLRLNALTKDFDDMVAASASISMDDEHDPEGSTIAFERSQVSALADQARRHLAELDDAEERLQAGRYGLCESCGSVIPAGRLEARPTATLCMSCASRQRH
ncbi:TraR/DksA family transcriptional regulator [Segeticoccus rhizosphaerae]|jgi:RNA polymerase-binding transcription factor DksA|uniref:TraR/DksA family transcriptional regulator n=1 Tax=Segeticoccus rhizosphaerae TaxID=1104777 RepID=UPI0010C0F347|nr:MULTISPECIES: TraR/DksA C4-type zinc finger protein [Intrasporangiaceae]